MAAASWRGRWRRCSSGAPGRARSRSSPSSRRRRSGTRHRSPARRRARRAIASCAARRREPPLPASDADIAFAPVTPAVALDRKKAADLRAADADLPRRIEQFDPKLRCVITLTREHALAQAQKADAEIAAGKYRGPLHGIPFGVKDLLDTAGIPTTYGAEPFRNRVPDADSAVVRRLHEAGAVLVAKLSLGALALNDIWFGGQTMNPWLLEEGASGSSAGPGAATAAALVGFSIGSETGGSIVSPSMRCGVTGLRPTFGRVPRTGAMTLCWSLDKLGPMTRGVEDAMLVLQAITGPDAGDVSSVPSHLDFDADGAGQGTARRLLSGVDEGEPGDRRGPRRARDGARSSAWCHGGHAARLAVRLAEHDPVRRGGGGVRGAHAQRPGRTSSRCRCPTRGRTSSGKRASSRRWTSCRPTACAARSPKEMARIFSQVDLLLVPSLRDEMLTITNFTGHPSLTLRAGFVEVSRRAATGRPTRRIRCRSSRRRAACRTASR